MFIGRFIFFSLEESPRYLVNTGRKAEAVAALKQITAFNGQSLKLSIRDVSDTPAPCNLAIDQNDERSSFLEASRTEAAKDTPPGEEAKALPSYSATHTESPRLSRDYPFHSPVTESPRHSLYSPPASPEVRAAALLGSPTASRRQSGYQRRSRSMSMPQPPSLPKRVLKYFTDPIGAWWEKLSSLLAGEARQKTLLIWAMWGLMSLGKFVRVTIRPSLNVLQGTQYSTFIYRSCWKAVLGMSK